jgi:uncharacterized protein
MLTAERVIALLELQPLPLEGGHFHETYRAGELIERECLPPRYAGARPHGSAIYYLLRDDTFSALHRLHSDEVYHFYLGQPVELLLLYSDGHGEIFVLGPDLEAGQRMQLVVPHGVWQGSRLRSTARGHFALLGTTMAPAYDPADFELGERADLLARYPGHAELIRALTPH